MKNRNYGEVKLELVSKVDADRETRARNPILVALLRELEGKTVEDAVKIAFHNDADAAAFMTNFRKHCNVAKLDYGCSRSGSTFFAYKTQEVIK